MTKPYEVSIVVYDDDGIIATMQCTQLPAAKGTLVESVIRPDINVKELSELFTEIGTDQRHNYYMSRVRSLSREAREAIERSLSEDDMTSTSPAPF